MNLTPTKDERLYTFWVVPPPRLLGPTSILSALVPLCYNVTRVLQVSQVTKEDGKQVLKMNNQTLRPLFPAHT